MKKAKILLLVFNIFLLCNLHGHSPVKNFFFELMRYEVTGLSDYENIEQYAGINKTPPPAPKTTSPGIQTALPILVGVL